MYRFRSVFVQFSLAALLALCAFLSGCGGGASTPRQSASTISVSVSPSSSTVQAGIGTQPFTATLQNDKQSEGVTWSLTGTGCAGNSCGTLSNVTPTSVIYAAPIALPNPASVTLTARSVADSTKTGAAAITLSAPVSVGVSPQSATVQIGKSASFAATVSNDSLSKGVNWSLSGAGCAGSACGTLSASSSASGAAITYTAPASVPNPAAVTLTAQSVRDPARSFAAAITLVPASSGSISVILSPKRGGLTIGQSISMQAAVSNDIGNAGVSWSASAGSFTTKNATSAVFVAPAAPGPVTVTATSVADGSQSSTTTFQVTDLAGVFTQHNNLSRDGSNTQEYALTPALITTSTFGRLFTCPVDAAVYAQPLWVANLTIAGAKHNVLFAVTQHDTVYAFDADASPCQTLWTKSLLGTNETWVTSSDVGTNDISPAIGIVGTPVIDPATNTIYLVGKFKNAGSGAFLQRLYALSLVDGTNRANSPALIASGGANSFALIQNQRSGLLLSGNTVYVAWASHGDNGPYHGFVQSYDKTSLNQLASFNDTPNGTLGGIWMAGAAPAADSAGNLYLITGNGTFNAANSNYGDSFLKLSSGLTLSDYFTPSDQANDEGTDADFGSGGAAILVNSPNPTLPNLAVGGGKDGALYVLNRDNMGHFGDSNAVQVISVGNSIFSTAAFWQNSLYLAPAGAPLSSYPLNPATSTFSAASSQSGTSFGWPGATPSISSHGPSDGVVWLIENASPAVLHAYDAANLATELWNSTEGIGNAAGSYVKFTVPTVANGKVYVGNGSQITVYGLLPN
jgi:hypothetical protein